MSAREIIGNANLFLVTPMAIGSIVTLGANGIALMSGKNARALAADNLMKDAVRIVGMSGMHEYFSTGRMGRITPWIMTVGGGLSALDAYARMSGKKKSAAPATGEANPSWSGGLQWLGLASSLAIMAAGIYVISERS